MWWAILYQVGSSQTFLCYGESTAGVRYLVLRTMQDGMLQSNGGGQRFHQVIFSFDSVKQSTATDFYGHYSISVRWIINVGTISFPFVFNSFEHEVSLFVSLENNIKKRLHCLKGYGFHIWVFIDMIFFGFHVNFTVSKATKVI